MGGWSIDTRCIINFAKLLNSGGDGLFDLVFLGNITLECQALGEKHSVSESS
jgi:hypothetical protein